MFLFEVRKYFKTKYKRCISISICILLVSIYSLITIYKFTLNDISQMNLNNYIIGELNIVQFVMFIAFPFLFSILISDLILDDFNSGYINFILPRAKNRLGYLICKFFMIIFIAILFTSFILISKYIIAIITRMPIKGELSIHISMVFKNSSIFRVYFYTIIYFISGLILIGMLSVFISINIKNSGAPVGIIILLGFLHNIFYLTESKYVSILPYSQYVLGLQDKFETLKFISCGYTLKFSFIYMWSLIFILFILTFNKIKKYEIRRIA